MAVSDGGGSSAKPKYIVYTYECDIEMVDCPEDLIVKPPHISGRVYFCQNCLEVEKPEGFRDGIDVLVADNRDYSGDNPNMEVFNAYEIDTREQIEAITSVLLAYNQDYPSNMDWGRTHDSLVFEWEIHNWAAGLGYKGAYDIGFDFKEEGFTTWDYVKKWLAGVVD